ncbi:MAG: hypothetical protein Salg2KO_16980 [Salibacteraceae bacterium]
MLLVIPLWTIGQANSYELLVLGTAQDAGFPQVDCQSTCCLNVKTEENVASIAIVGEKQFWIIDATPNYTEQYTLVKQEYPNHTLGGIFLTHAHIGHYTGLMYLGREAQGADSVPVYCMPRMAKFLRENGPWSQLVALGNIDIVELQKSVALQLSDQLSVTPWLVPHRDEFSETVGYVIQPTEMSALYIPDIDKWQHWDMDITTLISDLDLALVDATFFSATELPGRDMSEIPHPFAQETIELLQPLSEEDKSKVFFTHFNHTNPLIRDGSEADSVRSKGFQLARTGMRL